MYCDQCGQQNKDEAKFCTRCGAELGTQTSAIEKSGNGVESENTAEDSHSKAKRASVWTILSWLFGITLLLAGFGSFVTDNAILLDFLAGLLLIMSALLLIPPLRKISEKLLRRKLSAPVRSFAVVSLLLLFVYVAGEAERQRDAAIEKDKIAEFNEKKEQILDQMGKLISKGRFEEALSFSSNYAFISDEQLLALRKQAQSNLVTAQKARDAELERQRLAKEKEKELERQLDEQKTKDAAERAALILPGYWSCSNQSSFRLKKDRTFSYAMNGYAYQQLPQREEDRFTMVSGTYSFEHGVLRLSQSTLYFYWPDEIVESAQLKQNWDISDSPDGSYFVFRTTLLDDDELEMFLLEHAMPELKASPMVYPETERKEFRECKKLGDENYEDPSKVTGAPLNEAHDRAVNPAPEAVSADYSVVVMPMANPDMKLYRWMGVLEHMDRIEEDYFFIIRLGDPEYRFFATASKIADIDTTNLRVGG